MADIGVLNLSPYELALQEIREGKLNPYDIDVEHLVELFRKTAQELESSEYLREAGRFLEASAKLMRLQIEEVFPSPPKRREKKVITIQDVREALEDVDPAVAELDLSWLYPYTPRVGRPRGSKDTVERKLSWKEFWSQAGEVPLHREVNYHELAKEVRAKILAGSFSIKTITDFIAYLFAYHEYEDVPELPGMV